MPISSYIENIASDYARGIATEHTFRPALKALIEELVPEVAATNEPKRIECGAPDYVITRRNVPVGYIEAKDVGVDLGGKNLKEQFDRYRNALDNLVFTDYLDFRFYLNGEATASVAIGEVRGGKVIALPENFGQFSNLIREFCSRTSVTIKSSKRLAEMMAEKAKILAYIIKNALEEDIAAGIETDLTNQLKAFKDILIHDIDAKAFADIYAQTIAYGMFAARLHDPTLPTFSRQEAAELIPKTNPFLRKLFLFIATYDLDSRIDWIVDALADVFRAADIAAILKNFGKSTQTHDPIMHFYETFLAEYDPKLRKSRGVFYTPEPVVDFMVRPVDDILKSEFNLPNGLADTSKTKIKVDVQGKLQEREVHKVQILDPATGTGTFLATVIKHIHKQFENQQGVWDGYVNEHLIPRLNGFELLMASYAMAHLKLDLLLAELGNSTGGQASLLATPESGGEDAADASRMLAFQSERTQRFQIYLTNALEEYHPDTGTLFASWLSTEANEANHIKRDTPVMVVIGNPPYSGESANKGDWIMTLMDDYKKEPGGVEKLKERNPKWINDDYVKFLRYGQHFIEKNGEGILAFINPHGFLDNPTFRGMRWNLLKTYDKIYVLDLHGNTKKKETAPDGSADENVFDIMQGVSINIFVKTGKKKNDELAQVFHCDAYGKREVKYEFLYNGSLASVAFEILTNVAPNYFLVGKNYVVGEEYDRGFKVSELFIHNNVGILTARDTFTVHRTKENVRETIQKFLSLNDDDARKYFNLGDDARDWKVSFARRDIESSGPDFSKIIEVDYRPFDHRYTYYTGTSRGIHTNPRSGTMKHLMNGENLGLISCRQSAVNSWEHISIVNRPMDDCRLSNRTKERGYVFPLYLYPDDAEQLTLGGAGGRVPNLDMEIVGKIAAGLGLEFVAEPTGGQASLLATRKSAGEDAADASKMLALQSFAPIDLLDYIYAVLHSPNYREKYKEFLKIDFPRVPYPTDAAEFWRLVALGGELRQIHLLESPVVSKFITGFPVGGDNVVEKVTFSTGTASILLAADADASRDACVPVGNVYFNSTQYFSNVPETAWNFYIGGYQPAQKWLKDRKSRKLSFDDIQHYQKIIVALTETDRIMRSIDAK